MGHEPIIHPLLFWSLTVLALGLCLGIMSPRPAPVAPDQVATSTSQPLR